MSERQIINRVKKLQAMEEQKAQLEKEINTLKAEIQNEMNDLEEMQVGNFIIRFKNIISKRLDTTSLKSAYPAICNQFYKNTESRRFSVVTAK